MNKYEEVCFGCPTEKIWERHNQADNGAMDVAIYLSDAQEYLEQGNIDMARKLMNRAKEVLFNSILLPVEQE